MTPAPLCFSLLGAPTSLPWCAALPAILPCATTRSRPLDETDGLLIVGPLDEQALASAEAALLAGLPVLCLSATRLQCEHTLHLCEAARRGGALLRFALPWEPDGEASSLRRLLAGDEPMLRPRYVRVLRLAKPRDAVTLASLLNEELARIVELLGPARRVLALTSSSDLMSSQSAFVTLFLESEVRVQCTVSLAEGTEARQVVVATGDRALILDDLPGSQRLRSEAGPAEAGCGDELAWFCQAVRAGDTSLANFSAWRNIAALWAAASDSAGSGAPEAVLPFAQRAANAGPPPLRLIEGGGRGTGRAAAPRLTLVSV